MGLFRGLFGHKRKQEEPAARPVPVDANGNPIDPRLLRMLGDAPADERKDKSLGAILKRAGPSLAVARAYADGDYKTAALLQQDIAEKADKRMTAVELAQKRYRQAQQVAALPGMNEREFAAYMANPDQWASHMADALSSHHAAANVGQTETRVYGDPSKGGHVYQPPRLIENGVDQLRYDPQTGQSSIAVQGMTDGEQYARSLGAKPGTQDWANAVRDAELNANGPTAYRQRTQLEGQRQRGRVDLRQAPTYRDNNPLPPRAATPRGAPRTGGSRTSIPTISTPEEARRLPKGTKFKTPDGRVKVAG